MSDSWGPCGLQHAKLFCPSSSPQVCSNSCPLNQWCHPNISASVALFSFCLQSFPNIRSFPMSQLFTSGDQSIGASTLASVLPMSFQGWFPLRLTSLIFLLSNMFNYTVNINKYNIFIFKVLHVIEVITVQIYLVYSW